MSPDGADVDAAWVDYDSLMPASAAQVSPFGRHVRHWRAIRRMSHILFTAAGLPPAFPAHDLDSQALEPLGRVLDKVLRRHEPYPAWVVRQPFTFIRPTPPPMRSSPGWLSFQRGS